MHDHRSQQNQASAIAGKSESRIKPEAGPIPAVAFEHSAQLPRPLHFTARRFTRSAMFALALVLAIAVGAGAAASASANGDLVVTKGGDRSASNSSSGSTTYASPVAGARFEYTTDNTLPQTGWIDFTNLTDANGRATQNLPAGTYFVREKTTGPGFDNYGPVQGLAFDPNSGAPTAVEPYVARVVVQNNQTTYAYPHTNVSGNPNNWTPTNDGNNSNNGSPFINVRNNGVAPTVCGTNILLVLDRSGSINSLREQYEAAAKAFVDKLAGTPTQIGIVSFSSAVNSYDPATGSSSFYRAPLDLSAPANVAALNATISNIYDNPSGGTDWDQALSAAAAAKSFTANGVTGQTVNPDRVIFITDGNPTFNETDQGGNGSDVSLFNVTAGMASANLLKNQNARPGRKLDLFAIGVDNETGLAPTAANLRAVSGPIEGSDGDYATPTISELEAVLSETAAVTCGARVFVRKRLGTNPANQPGWGYTATDPRPSQTPTYLDGNPSTHDRGGVIETGAVFQQLPATPTTVNINENATGQPLAAGSFNLTSVDCRSGSYNGTAFPGGVKNGLNFSLPVNRGDAVYCTYTNDQPPNLAINKSHTGNFTQGQVGASYNIAVSNQGPGSTTGTVTVTDSLPAGLTATAIGGNGWNCVLGTLTCTRSDTLAANASYPPITLTVNVANNAGSPLVNSATASGGGDPTPVTDDDPTVIRSVNLAINKSHNGDFARGQTGATYNVVVSNQGPDSTAGQVSVTDALPNGLTATAINGPGWNCTLATLTCTRSDVLAANASYPPITLTVNVANNAPLSLINSATASGGGDPTPVTDDDPTNVLPANLAINKSHTGNFTQGQVGASYNIAVSNQGPGSTTGPVTVTDCPAERPHGHRNRR